MGGSNVETDQLNDRPDFLPYNAAEPDAQPAPVPASSGSTAQRIAWLVAGFNVGFVLFLAGLFGLNGLLPGFQVQRAGQSAGGSSGNRTVIIAPNSVQQTAQAFQPSATPTTEVPASPTASPTLNLKATARANAAATDQAQLALTPSATATPRPSPTPIPPTATPEPPPASYSLEGITFYQQKWNNCGPANLAMGLSYYNWDGTQDDTASWLKPNQEDKNVTPQQMADYVNRFTNLRASWRMAGSIDQIKWLVANEFVVIVESGYTPAGESWYGHFETVAGYTNGTITVYDSYLGRASRPTITYSESQFDRQWQSFNRNYIVIYPPAREDELRNFLGGDWNERTNRANAVRVAQQEAQEQPNNAYAWFNLGTSLTAIGRYEEAVVAYERAFEIGLPYRMMWYQFSPYEAYLQTGRLDEVLALANNTLRTTRYVEEIFYYRGRVYEVRGDYAAAALEYQNAVSFNPNHSQAQAALNRVQSYQ